MRPDRPSDPPLLRTTLESGPIAFADEGSGAPVVALHGIPGSGRDFRWLAPAASDRMRFVRPDLPGFGETPEETAPALDVEARADVAIAFIEKLALGPVVLVGHSMGGVLAVQVAVARPDLVTALFLISTPGLTVHRGFRRIPLWLFRPLLKTPNRARRAYPLVRRLFAQGGFRGPYPPAVYRRTILCIDGMRFDDHAARIARLACPTAVVWCADDPLIEADISKSMAEACPDGPRLVFSDGGHNPQKHHAVEIAEAMATLATAVK